MDIPALQNGRADVIVVGLGAMGSASLYQVAKRGGRVIGIDRYRPPHMYGSSHGDTRITRQAIGEGSAYTPLVLRSHEIWRELEAATGESLLQVTGGLVLGNTSGKAQHHGRPDFLERTIGVARQFGIEHEVLSAPEISQRFPPFQLNGAEVGYFEPGAGYVYPEHCIDAQLQQAQQFGAEVRTDEVVLEVSATAGGVRVVTNKKTYEAGQVIVSAGPWLPRLLGEPFASLLKVYRQVLYWFEPERPEEFSSDCFPIFIWMHGDGDEDYFYGFPTAPGSQGVKVASEQYAHTTSPNTVDRNVTDVEVNGMFTGHVRDRLPGLSSHCLKTTGCLYTVTPDSNFIIDRHPDNERILVASPCSGHGFKHSAAIGEGLAELALTGRSRFDLSPFSLQRFI
jgi:sarcosine oxidase